MDGPYPHSERRSCGKKRRKFPVLTAAGLDWRPFLQGYLRYISGILRRGGVIIDFRVQAPKLNRSADRACYMMRYVDIFDLESVSYSKAELFSAPTEAGIQRAVMQAEWSSGDYRKEIERVAAIVRTRPDS